MARRKLQSSSISFQASEKYFRKLWLDTEMISIGEGEREDHLDGHAWAFVAHHPWFWALLMFCTYSLLHVSSQFFWLYGVRAKGMRSALSRRVQVSVCMCLCVCVCLLQLTSELYYIRCSGSIGYRTAEGADRLNDFLHNQTNPRQCVYVHKHRHKHRMVGC